VLLCPLLSVHVNVAVTVVDVLYVCVATSDGAVEASPKFHRYVNAPMPEHDAVNVTGTPTAGVRELAATLATSGAAFVLMDVPDPL
jgi:hypothetical protein